MNGNIESINALTSDMVLGYFESFKGNFYLKLGVLLWFEGGAIEQHKALSENATLIATEFGDEVAGKMLASIRPEVVENLKEDACTSLVLSAWSVFEQIIKDLTVPDYATQPNLLQADYHRNSLGFSASERAEIDLFYYLRNAIAHYNGAYHAYKTVNASYGGRTFVSTGHLGEKIEVSPKLAMAIADDLEKYAMQAWTRAGRP